MSENQSPGSMLADEMYAEPEAVVEEQPASESEVVEAEAEETPAVETVAEDSEVVAEVASDEVEVSTLAELAEHLETEPDWINTLKTTQKVNGKDVEFSISEAIDTHMQVEAGNDYLTQAKSQAKAIIDEATRERESITGTAAVFGELVTALEAEINGSTDWDKLRRDDPAEYAARRDEQRERKAKLDNIKDQALEKINSTAAQAGALQAQQLENSLPQEREVFLERIPEWKDADKAAAEQPEVMRYLTDEGYSAEDIKVASYNGKLMSIAVKAMRYDKSKHKSDAAKKKVVNVPKIQKPGAKKEHSNASSATDDPVSILYG